ncbi:MAG: ABC transporter substrate-binding protein [Armatimonadota bacterium]|nr:ABC transporter substrate-binding protein [Armatimonadota bacterium]MDR7485248.1 ABC transporter substrate-binding protein [Armatimonadota bacterium]MDR7537123.1 ABC transporter substrate-binding protein [Armatimonadota bacterium]
MQRWVAAALLCIALVASGPALAQAPKVLRVATDTNLPWLDPHMGTAFTLRELSAHVFEGLVTIGEDYGVIPQLAESWTVSADGLHYTFRLRAGVKFHNGKTLGAEDVKASVERFVQYSARRGDVAAVGSVTVVDPLTVRITLKEPQGSFIGALANPVSLLGIMPREVVEGARDPIQPPNLIGTGPFRLAEWARDRQITLRRFPDYARDRRMPASGLGGDRQALVDEIHIISILESATRLAALERGDVDYAQSVAPAAYDRLRTSPVLDAIVIKPFTQVILQLNANRPPFNNVKARQAVSRGLDMEAIMRAVTGNQPAFYRLQPSFFFPEQRVWHNTEGAAVYNGKNLDLARRLLRESGYDGRPITFVTNRDIEWLFRAAVPVKPQLEAIGFRVDLVVRDWPGQIAQQREGNFDMATNGVSTRPEPTGFNYLFQCGASYETYGYCDPEMDKWLIVGLRVRDPERRAQAYAMAQRQFYESVPFVKVGDMFSLDGATRALKGYKIYFLRRYWNVTK